MTRLLIAGAASALLFGSAALAQSTPAPAADAAPAPAAAAPSTATSFSDGQLKSFATVTLALQKTPGLDATTTAKMVTDSGLSIAEYNQIAAAMKTDPAVNTKIQTFAAATAPEAATSTPAPATSATPGPAAKTRMGPAK